jgi:sortase A
MFTLNPTRTVFQYRQKKAMRQGYALPADSTIYYRKRTLLPRFRLTRRQLIGLALLVVCVGALISAFSPVIKAEIGFQIKQKTDPIIERFTQAKNAFFAPLKIMAGSSAPSPLPDFNPLQKPDGGQIIPVNTDFAIVIPKLGINANVVPGVNPVDPVSYIDALKKGVAHSSTSFYPNENGTVYLFSHSTNYEWYVKDLNAIFYLLKNLEPGDLVVLIYLNQRYTYTVREKKIISTREISYLEPQRGTRNLILQTCWPPGTTLKRMLIFADLLDERPYQSPAANTPKSGSFAALLSDR